MAARKGALALALGLGKAAKSDEDEAVGTEDSGGEAAAQAFIDATSEGDAAAVLSAFKELYEHCQSEPEPVEPEDDETETEDEY